MVLSLETSNWELAQDVVPQWWEKLMTCMQCGTCSATCPTAYAMDYTPRQLWQMLRLGLENEVLTSRTFWLCTVCKSCQVRCPRGIRLTDTMVALKEYAQQRGVEIPERLVQLSETVTSRYNISGEDNATRLIWSQNLPAPPPGVAPLRETAEVVYFIGCVGSFYPRTYSIPQSLVELLHRAGVNFTVMGGDEWCCGYPLYVSGSRRRIADLAQHNVESIRRLKARRVIFSCPSCFYAFTHLYPEVVDLSGLTLQHSTEFLAELVTAGAFNLGPLEQAVTYHDPCDLGRKSGVYEAPRQIIRAIPGLELREMEASRENSLCCGGGGDVEIADPAVTQGVAARRIAQVEATGAQYVASACQQCMRTLQESARKNRVRVRTLDVVELLWLSVQAAEELKM